jgi:hypothetical protein
MGKATRCRDPKAVGIAVLGRSAHSHAPGCSLRLNVVNKDHVFVVVYDHASLSW